MGPGAEARPERPPRRRGAAAAVHRAVCVNQLVGGHPVGRTRATRPATIILAKIWRVGSRALRSPGCGAAGRLYGPRAAPAVWRAAADSGLQSVQTAGHPQTPGRLAPRCTACSREVTPTLQWHQCTPPCPSSTHQQPFSFQSCISASWVAGGEPAAAANTLHHVTLHLPSHPHSCGKVKNAGEQRCGGFGEKCS